MKCFLVSFLPRATLVAVLVVTAAACATQPAEQVLERDAGGGDGAVGDARNFDPALLAAAVAPTAEEPQPFIVNLRLDVDEGADDATREERIAEVRRALLARLPHDQVTTTRVYALVPAVALRAKATWREAIGAMAEVDSVQDDLRVQASLQFAAPMVQALDAHKSGFTGKGVRIAVIDTGVDAQHPDLAGHVAAQHCFTQGACPPNGAAESGSAVDDEGHGTHVAGILVSAGKVAAPGIAPGADVVAVRVLDQSGSGSQSDILAGLDWVAAHAKALHVRVVNMSLGSQQSWAAACDKSDPATSAAVKLLGQKGVAVFAAAGNEGVLNGLGNPACLAQVHAVGAVYSHDLVSAKYPGLCSDKAPKAGALTCFSNRGKNLHLVAPGAPIVSVGMGGGTATMSGTSQASPVAAGVAALLMACKPTLTSAALDTLLQQTGKPVKDPLTGQTFRLVQAVAATKAACGK